MSSSLFGTQQPTQRPNLQQMAEAIKGNPEALFNQLYQNNPRFKEFIDTNRGLSVEQIAQKYGIPLK